jgi:hypothetical protein
MRISQPSAVISSWFMEHLPQRLSLHLLSPLSMTLVSSWEKNQSVF